MRGRARKRWSRAVAKQGRGSLSGYGAVSGLNWQLKFHSLLKLRRPNALQDIFYPMSIENKLSIYNDLFIVITYFQYCEVGP